VRRLFGPAMETDLFWFALVGRLNKSILYTFSIKTLIKKKKTLARQALW
jgi:hypothetical protein